jgi:hypothetical protein
MKTCSECGSMHFGLVRYRWGMHHFCKKQCMERFKKRLEAEVKRRKFIAWFFNSSQRSH